MQKKHHTVYMSEVEQVTCPAMPLAGVTRSSATSNSATASLLISSIPVNQTIIMANPLTTDDECTRHATGCYQLAQSILKIGFALAKRWDRGK